MIKKLIIFSKIFIVFTLLLTLSSCNSSNTQKAVMTEKGEVIKYPYEQFINSDMEGLYILNLKSGEVSPLMNKATENEISTSFLSNISHEIMNDDNFLENKILWYSINEKNGVDLTKLIPKVDKDNVLIAKYEDESGMYGVDKDGFIVKNYSEKGYTVGSIFNIGEDNRSLYVDTGTICKVTDMENTIKNLDSKNDEGIPVYKINNTKTMPVNNINPYTRIFEGLEKNKTYIFHLLKGTKVYEYEIKADTKYFGLDSLTTIKNPYTQTDRGYFLVNLPKTLKNGYYFIEDYGMFKLDM